MIAAASATRAVVVVSRGDRPDWWKITDDLRKAGVTIEQQAHIVGVSKAAVLGWRNLDAEPSYTAHMLEQAADRIEALETELLNCESDYEYLQTVTPNTNNLHGWLQMRAEALRSKK